MLLEANMAYEYFWHFWAKPHKTATKICLNETPKIVPDRQLALYSAEESISYLNAKLQ